MFKENKLESHIYSLEIENLFEDAVKTLLTFRLNNKPNYICSVVLRML